MTIEFRGEGCFEIRGVADKVSLITEYPNRESGLVMPRVKTDIYLSVWGDFEDTILSAEKEDRFFISSPGEYELKDVFISGMKSSVEEGQIKTAYIIKMEDLKIGYLGEVSGKDIVSDLIAFFEDVDVLILPVGGNGVLETKEAAKVINQIEPKIVIPSHYKTSGLKIKREDLSVFLNEVGEKDASIEKKILLKKKDIASEGIKIIPLSNI